MNLDLIYGTPGETDEDWRGLPRRGDGAGPDHVSAYALIVEDGTRLAARVRRGELPMPDDDDAGRPIPDGRGACSPPPGSRGTRCPTGPAERPRCRHNELYWTGADWWGAGPGAHSHVGGTRWWNVQAPGSTTRRLLAESRTRAGREVLDARGAPGRAHPAGDSGSPRAAPLPLPPRARRRRPARWPGLLDPAPYATGRAVLTLRGRLLADAVVRSLI